MSFLRSNSKRFLPADVVPAALFVLAVAEDPAVFVSLAVVEVPVVAGFLAVVEDPDVFGFLAVAGFPVVFEVPAVFEGLAVSGYPEKTPSIGLHVHCSTVEGIRLYWVALGL